MAQEERSRVEINENRGEYGYEQYPSPSGMKLHNSSLQIGGSQPNG